MERDLNTLVKDLEEIKNTPNFNKKEDQAKFNENIQGDVKEQCDFLCSNFYDEKYLGWSPLGDMTCSEYIIFWK